MVNILVADDDPDILGLVEMKLQAMGHVVTTASDGAAALVAASATNFDIAIFDVAMPGSNGIEVTSRIRDSSVPPRMPIILMSAFATEADIRDGYDAGADDYVTKPFSPRDLGERVEALLSRSDR